VRQKSRGRMKGTEGAGGLLSGNPMEIPRKERKKEGQKNFGRGGMKGILGEKLNVPQNGEQGGSCGRRKCNGNEEGYLAGWGEV